MNMNGGFFFSRRHEGLQRDKALLFMGRWRLFSHKDTEVYKDDGDYFLWISDIYFLTEAGGSQRWLIE